MQTAGGGGLTLLAPAKVNLFLDVIGKLPDGYHELRSIVVPISLCDELTLEPTDGAIDSVTSDAAGLPERSAEMMPDSAENLATKAAYLLKRATGYPGGARISIKKSIPIGGGLGGGSADAAVTLKGLNELWGTGVSQDRLVALAAQVGCDVPAILFCRAVCMEGKGERISLLNSAQDRAKSEWWLVVVNPGFSVLTRDAYARYKSTLTCPPETFNCVKLALEKGDVELAGGSLFNALQATVFAKYPLLGILAGDLKAAGALGVLLSGSGASVFALAGNRRHAEAIEAEVRSAHGSWLWSRVVKMLPDGVTGSTRPFGG
jgi:4-diphosphocytidyl-2-C-methyl-D-erythritol kinase